METGTTWKPQRISAHIPPRAQIVSEEQSRNFLFLLSAFYLNSPGDGRGLWRLDGYTHGVRQRPVQMGTGKVLHPPPREHHFITFELKAAEARAPWKLSSRVNIAHKYQLFIGKQHQRESWCWSGFFFTWKRENNSCFIWMLKKKTTNLQNLTLYRVSRQAFFCPSLGRVQKCTRV